MENLGVVADIPDRRITKQTCAKFKVTVEYDTTGSIAKHHYPYFAVDSDEMKGSKVRLVKSKDFYATSTNTCLLYTSPSPRDGLLSRMPSSA